MKADAITRPCKKCGKNIRWGAKQDGKPISARLWLAHCWSCLNRFRKEGKQ